MHTFLKPQNDKPFFTGDLLNFAPASKESKKKNVKKIAVAKGKRDCKSNDFLVSGNNPCVELLTWAAMPAYKNKQSPSNEEDCVLGLKDGIEKRLTYKCTRDYLFCALQDAVWTRIRCPLRVPFPLSG